jgi:KTSC domain
MTLKYTSFEIVSTIQSRGHPFKNETRTARMTWLPLESKMLASAAYDADKQILHLRFRKSGDVYRYFEFPAADYQSFRNAESKGRFFLAQIRDHFPYERLAKLQAA